MQIVIRRVLITGRDGTLVGKNGLKPLNGSKQPIGGIFEAMTIFIWGRGGGDRRTRLLGYDVFRAKAIHTNMISNVMSRAGSKSRGAGALRRRVAAADADNGRVGLGFGGWRSRGRADRAGNRVERGM